MSFHFYTTHNFIQYISYSLIVATDDRGGIGFKNRLPWKGLVDNKKDMEWFKEKTLGKVIVMGWNTWKSIGKKPLPGRVNIILSENHKQWFLDNPCPNVNIDPETAKTDLKSTQRYNFSNIEDVLDWVNKNNGYAFDKGEIMIIGGASIYKAFAEHISKIYLTTFTGEFEADTFLHLNTGGFELEYKDSTSFVGPKFEIFAYRKDFISVEHGHKPATGIVKEIMSNVKKEEDNV